MRTLEQRKQLQLQSQFEPSHRHIRRIAIAIAVPEPEPRRQRQRGGTQHRRPAARDGRGWIVGARVWKDIDIGVAVRRVDPAHVTVVPQRDGSGSGSSGSQRAPRTVMDIFANEPSSDEAALTSDAGMQVDACPSPPAENEDVQAAARESVLEDEGRGMRTLLEDFRCRRRSGGQAVQQDT